MELAAAHRQLKLGLLALRLDQQRALQGQLRCGRCFRPRRAFAEGDNLGDLADIVSAIPGSFDDSAALEPADMLGCDGISGRKLSSRKRFDALRFIFLLGRSS